MADRVGRCLEAQAKLAIALVESADRREQNVDDLRRRLAREHARDSEQVCRLGTLRRGWQRVEGLAEMRERAAGVVHAQLVAPELQRDVGEGLRGGRLTQSASQKVRRRAGRPAAGGALCRLLKRADSDLLACGI